MEKVLNFINIPRSIIRLRKRKIIELYTGEKQNSIERDYLLIWIILILLVVVNYFIKTKEAGLISLGVLVVFLVILKFRGKKGSWSFSGMASAISKVVLKDEDGKNIKVWELHNKKSLLIGKKTKSNEVDIDLGNSIYSSLISREHAILNFTGNKWYFEDIGSSNGSGIKRKSDEKKIKVEEGKSYGVSSGDVIYIANTKLILK